MSFVGAFACGSACDGRQGVWSGAIRRVAQWPEHVASGHASGYSLGKVRTGPNPWLWARMTHSAFTGRRARPL